VYTHRLKDDDPRLEELSQRNVFGLNYDARFSSKFPNGEPTKELEQAVELQQSVANIEIAVANL